MKEFNLSDNSVLIAIVARLVPLKAHEVLLKAVHKLISNGCDIHVLIVGDGPRRKELEDLSQSLRISDRVVFTGYRTDVPQILNLIDIFVLSSDWEGFPMTILEAMASGKPVVCTDVGGNREAVVNGETGFIVPPRDIKFLSESLFKLIQYTDLRKEMGERGKERFLKNFTVDVMVKKTESIYEEFFKTKNQ